jgi:hypothetical protein
MAGALTACAFYFIQDYKDGKIIWFNVNGYKNKIQRFMARKKGTGEEDEEVHAKMLLSISDAMTSFIVGMEKIFGALVVLILAWASGAIMVSVGLSKFAFVRNIILIFIFNEWQLTIFHLTCRSLLWTHHHK